jgi:hypothetical protein
VVYHGLAGHYLLQEIPHVLKVRIIAEMGDRIKEEMKRENISAEKVEGVKKVVFNGYAAEQHNHVNPFHNTG